MKRSKRTREAAIVAPVNSDPEKYLTDEDRLIATDLFAAGLNLQTIEHSLQAPSSTVKEWVAQVAPPKTVLIRTPKWYMASEHEPRYALTKTEANLRVHPKPVPRWWACEFGYERQSVREPMDAMWSLEEFPNQASLFIDSDWNCVCAVCAKRLLATQKYFRPDEYNSAAPVGTQVRGYTPGQTNIDQYNEMLVSFGVGEMVCTTCWPAYEGRIEGLLKQRRERIRAFLKSELTKHDKVEEKAVPSELQLLCERYGVSHNNLWIALDAKGDALGEKTYFKVNSIAGDTVNISLKGLTRRASGYSIAKANFERLLIAGKAVNSDTLPIYKSALQAFCDAQNIARQALVISVKGSPAKAVFLEQGKIYFESKALEKGRYYTRTPEEVQQLIEDGVIKSLPLIRCTDAQGGMRFPSAQDPDLRNIAIALAEAMPQHTRADVALFSRTIYMESPVSVWRRLAAIANQIGKPHWGAALKNNIQSLTRAQSNEEHCLAGYLMYMMTANRTSILGRPVLQPLYSNGRYERLFEPMIDDWMAADGLLKPYFETGKQLGLHKLFV
jgi:hypothetical protein